MKSRLGCSTLSALVSITALSAVGVGGYSAFTGKSLCATAMACPGDDSAEKASTTVQVANKSSDTEAKSCSEAKSCCAMGKMAKTRKAVQVAGMSAKEMCGKTMTVQTRSLNAVILGATYPVAVPAAFYDNTAALDSSKLVSKGSCGVAKSCKTTCESTRATVINAAATEKAEDGCCKGSGERADKKSCCGKCPGKSDAKASEPVAEKPAETAQNPS